MTDWRTDERADIARDALSVLDDVLAWRMSAARWEGIAASVEVLAASLRTGDLVAAQAAVVQLELAGPVRTTRIGAKPTEPPPPPVRERINHLIYQLSGRPGAVQGDGSGDDGESTGQPGDAS
jgi:hypothetical protein